MHNKVFLVFLFWLKFFENGFANDRPVLQNVTTTLRNNKVTVRLNIKDTENDSVQLIVKVLDFKNKEDLSDLLIEGDANNKISVKGRKSFSFSIPHNVRTKDLIIKITVHDFQHVNIGETLDKVDTARIRQLVGRFASVRNGSVAGSMEQARAKFRSYLDSVNFSTTVQQFNYEFGKGENVIGTSKAVNSNVAFIVGAHLDTVDGSPGADDNGSGIAGILEISTLLSEIVFDNSLEVVAFDLEEVGLVGSREFANNIDLNQPPIGYLNFDMIGYSSREPNSQGVPEGFDVVLPEIYGELVKNEFRGDFILAYSNTASNRLIRSFDSSARSNAPQLRTLTFIAPDDGNSAPDIFKSSDHASFWDIGINALAVTDTGGLRNPNYHTGFDIEQTIDIQLIAGVVKTAIGVIFEYCHPLHGDQIFIKIDGLDNFKIKNE